MYYKETKNHIEMQPNEVISFLLKESPKFAASVDLEEGPYSILDDFALYICDGITNDTFEADELDRAFNFLNEMGSSGNIEVQNLLVVGVLEILTDTSESINISKQKLTGQALQLFEQALLCCPGGG